MSLETRKVVTNFLRYKDKILILRRSKTTKTYRGVWAGISGYIEKGDTSPKVRAEKEINEEVGLRKRDLKLVKIGNPLKITEINKNIVWIVHPFLWDVSTDKLELDWEHDEVKWIFPEELANFKTVPQLIETLKKVLEF